MRRVVIVCIIAIVIALWLARAALAVSGSDPIAVAPALESPPTFASPNEDSSAGFLPLSTRLRSISPFASSAYSVPG